DVFPEPLPLVPKAGTQAKVPGTDGQKMSKSYGNTIDIFAEGKPLDKTIMGIKTDSTPMGQPLNPDTCTVFTLYSLFATEDEKAQLAADYRSGKIGYGGAKKLLKVKVDTFFAPFREKRKELAARPETVESILQEGARRARAEAAMTMKLVREAAGLT